MERVTPQELEVAFFAADFLAAVFFAVFFAAVFLVVAFLVVFLAVFFAGVDASTDLSSSPSAWSEESVAATYALSTYYLMEIAHRTRTGWQ